MNILTKYEKTVKSVGFASLDEATIQFLNRCLHERAQLAEAMLTHTDPIRIQEINNHIDLLNANIENILLL